MKKMISVKSDHENYDISLNMKMLDRLPNSECIILLTHLQHHIAAYKRLRHGRKEIEVAEREIAVANSESTGAYFDDIPF